MRNWTPIGEIPLTTCAGNWLRTITSDRTVHNKFVAFFLNSSVWWIEVISFLFVLPALYLNMLKTEKILQFWDVPAQEVKRLITIDGCSSIVNSLYFQVSYSSLINGLCHIKSVRIFSVWLESHIFSILSIPFRHVRKRSKIWKSVGLVFVRDLRLVDFWLNKLKNRRNLQGKAEWSGAD